MYLNLSVIISAVLATLVAAVPVQELEQRDPWSDQVLSLHNRNRAQYGARPLTWSNALYPGVQQWASQCKFMKNGGNYGENLTAGTGAFGLVDAMKRWMEEADLYNYANPGYTASTSHFTQVVWKGTTQVACAIADCPSGTIFSQASKYIVCRYTPPGNVNGQFAENVGRRV